MPAAVGFLPPVFDDLIKTEAFLLLAGADLLAVFDSFLPAAGFLSPIFDHLSAAGGSEP